MNARKMPLRPRSWPKSSMLAALLLSPILAHSVGRITEAPAPDTWTVPKIEAAFHDILGHGDLSDIDFLARTLGLDLEVVEWEKPAILQKEAIETHAMATRVPSYLLPYGTSYTLTRNTTDGKTRIYFNFAIRSCPDLSLWGTDWNQQVQTSGGMATDGGPYFQHQSIRWQQNARGIVLERTTSTGSCSFTLQQDIYAAVSIPKPPAITPGPGTELLDRIIDLVVAGDLRDYLTTGRILHTEMSTYGKLHGRLLYDGGATPETVIPGTDTRWFIYFVNDTGWIDMGAPVFIRRHAPRNASLSIFVDTVSNCISPASLEARLQQKHVYFRKKSDRDFGPYLKTFQHGNAFSIGYFLQDACIEEMRLSQISGQH